MEWRRVAMVGWDGVNDLAWPSLVKKPYVL